MFYIGMAAFWLIWIILDITDGTDPTISIIFMVMNLTFFQIGEAKKEIIKVIKENNND